MKVALTGAPGFIESRILTDLHEHGREVTSLLRDAVRADIAEVRGAIPVVIDLYDQRAVTSLLAAADGAIRAASVGDGTCAGLDSAARARAGLGWYASRRSRAGELCRGSCRR
jgi:putative NADH-flavin reductase